MSNHQHLDDGRRWRIVGRQEAGQSQAQICREFDLTPSVTCNLWKQFQDTGSIQRKPGVTVSKRLHETGLFARRPAVCVPLTSTNRRVRLAWCREHRDWSMDKWATVLFTDESRFSLNTDSRRTFIWEEPGTRYLPSNVCEIDH
ncbi:hypothetical protein AVEN_161393-1 [Araneus ventricosus]|uniref:Transposase Tc1-like domain-containing protein n=1 Tax=Araneus ventricosus TaxID=182803 RepID=A0A4Y2FLI7_ARAVE|nr:hypothetical protein AVEN_161393-1 [Araneus ventricosus]